MQGADVGVGPLEFEVVPANGIDRWNIMQVQAWVEAFKCIHIIIHIG